MFQFIMVFLTRMSRVGSTLRISVRVAVGVAVGAAAAAVRVAVFDERSGRAKVGVQHGGHDDVEGDAATGRDQHGVGVDLKVFVDDPLDGHEDQDARQQPDHHDREQSPQHLVRRDEKRFETSSREL